MDEIIVCHLVSGDLWAGAENQSFNIIAGLNKIRNCRVMAIVMNRGKLYQELSELGIKTFLVDEKQHTDIVQLIKILKIIKNNNVNIIHAHRYKENIFAGIIKLFQRSVSLVKTQHGTFNIIKNMSSFRMYIYWLIDLIFTKYNYDGIIGVSNEISQQFEKYIEKKKIYTVMNSVCPSRYNVAAENKHYGRKNCRPLKLALIGRLVKIKNVEEFIEIAFQLNRRGLSFVSYVVGSGPEENRLKKASGELYQKKVLQFLGEINDVSKILNEIDILFITSIHEGLPTVLLEGMFFKKIVISKPVGGIPYVLLNNKNGFLYSNISDAVDIVMKIHKSTSKFQSIREQARNTVENRFLFTIQANKYMDIYKTILMENQK